MKSSVPTHYLVSGHLKRVGGVGAYYTFLYKNKLNHSNHFTKTTPLTNITLKSAVFPQGPLKPERIPKVIYCLCDLSLMEVHLQVLVLFVLLQ